MAAIALWKAISSACAILPKQYKRRRDIVLVKGLHEAGWMVEMPSLNVRLGEVPEQYAAMGSLEFAKLL